MIIIFDLETCVGFITSKSAKIMADAFNKRLKKLGITRVQWTALYYLGLFHGISQKELADRMNIKESSIARLIDRMAKDELLSRTKDAGDRRITCLYLTEKGTRLREDLLPEGQNMSEIFAQNIPDEDIEVFNRVLKKMIDNVKDI